MLSIQMATCCPDACLCQIGDIYDGAKTFRGMRVVCMPNSNLTSLPASIPEDSEELSITGGRFRSISQDNFTRLPILKKLELTGCEISLGLKTEAFSNLTHLRYLGLRYSNIQTIQKDVFKGINNLNVLDVAGNGLTNVDFLVFANISKTLNLAENLLNGSLANFTDAITNLENLDLSQNRFTSLYLDFGAPMLALKYLIAKSNRIRTIIATKSQQLPKLSIIYLQNNKLEKLGRNCFGKLPSLARLHLEDNEITAIGDGTFDEMFGLEELYLHGNKMARFDWRILKSTRKLRRVRLWKNHIESMQFDNGTILPDMTFLDLSDNYLETIPAQFFCMFPNINHEVSLARNKIKTIEDGAFCNVTTLRNLLLNGNNLQTLPDYLLSPFESISFVSMADNPLHCNCELVWFREFLGKTSTRVLATCNTPSKVDVVRLPIDAFRCHAPSIPYMVVESVVACHSCDGGTNRIATLDCVVRGDPVPDLIWKYDNTELIYDRPLPHKSLTLRREKITVNLPVVGKKLFTCKGSNFEGFVQSDIILSSLEDPDKLLTSTIAVAPSSDRTTTNAPEVGRSPIQQFSWPVLALAVFASVCITVVIYSVLVLIYIRAKQTRGKSYTFETPQSIGYKESRIGPQQW